MRILFDTNIIIDVIQKREPFFIDSLKTFEYAIKNYIDCLIPASSVSDIYYILKRAKMPSKEIKGALIKLSQIVTFADLNENDIYYALNNESMNDIENAIISEIAKRNDADLIITRNTKDFKNSLVRAISPSEFLTTISNL